MFCKNCGNEMKENQKFCSKCGTKAEFDQEEIIAEKPVAESVAEPVVEETIIEEPVLETAVIEETEAPVQITEEIAKKPDMEMPGLYIEPIDEPKVKKPKKKRFLKVFIPVILVLALAVSGFAHPLTRNILMRTFMSSESYFAYVVENSAKDIAKSIVGAVSEYRAMLDGEFEGVSGSYEFELGNVIKDYVYEVADYEVYEAVEWIDTVGARFDMGKTDDVLGANLKYSINGTDLLSANAAYEGGTLYLTVPEINDEAIGIDLLSLLVRGQGDYFAAEGFMDSLNEIMEIIPSDKVLEDIIVRYITAVAKGIEDIDEDNIEIEAGGIKERGTSMTFTVDDRLLKDVSESVLKELAEDKDIEKLIKDVCELSMVDLDSDDVYDEFLDSIDGFMVDVDNISEVNNDIEICLIANNYGEVNGISAEIDGAEIEFYLTKDGKDYGQLLSINPGQSMGISIEGNGTVSGGKYDGEILLSAGGMDIVKMSLESVDKGLWADGIFNGTMVIAPTEGVGTLLGTMADNELISLISGLKLEMVSDSDKKGGDLTLAVSTGEDLIASINAAYTASTDAEYEVPGSYTEITDESDMENWVQSSQGSIMNLLSKLTEAGFPSHLIMGEFAQ